MNKIFQTVKLVVLALVLSFGLSYAIAWTAPTVTPPGGNVSAPINTGPITQTKMGGDICINISGVIKCLSSTSAIVPAATISATSASCTIASGASTCSVSVTWNITNATTPNLYNSTTGVQISALASGTISPAINYGANTLQARNGSVSLASISETAVCASGTIWNGSSCAPTSATITVNKPTGETVIVCQIPDGGSTCSGSVTWGTSNVTTPNLYNATAGTQIAVGNNSTITSFTNFAYGLNWFSVRNGTTQLASDSGKAVCSGEPNPWFTGNAWWNGTICDPAWVAKASMPTSRGYASAAVLNSKIYVFGGVNSSNLITGTTEEYDPATNSWATRTSMPNPRQFTGAATVGTKIYVIGGSDVVSVSAKNEEYAPLSDTWTTKLSLPTGSWGVPAVTVGTKIYYMSNVATRVYDPSLNTWVAKAGMTILRSEAAAVAIGTDVYVLGGGGSGATCSQTGYTTCFTNEKYDTLANTWTTKASMNYSLEGHTAAVVNGKIYVTGGRAGFTNGANWFTQEYNPVTNTWRARAKYTQRLYAATAVVNNKIYIIGQGYGWGYSPSGYNTEYDPAKDFTL